MFKIIKKDSRSQARVGLMNTAHGQVNTPAFLAIGTRGSVKAVTAEELKFWRAEIILANTYHLWMRPGDAIIKKSGGLHKFMGWDGPILTDSGGFQVFSLLTPPSPPREERDKGRGGGGRVLEVSEKGVVFQSDIDGKMHILTPEESINVQSNLGSDIALVLDFFPGYPFTYERVEKAVDLTLRWAERSLRQFQKIHTPHLSSPTSGEELKEGEQRLFGIVQGGDFPELREKCAHGLKQFDFPGYAIGGVAVGEPEEVMYKAVEATVPHLEEDKPRHLLGVGTPEQIIQAVARGCDMFDCVLPTRNARHGELYVNLKRGQPFLTPDPSPSREGEGGRRPGEGYTTLKIRNEQYKEDFTPPDNTCPCYLCTHHTRAYLRHLFMSGEPLAIRLATMHNLRFYFNLMEKIRRAIKYDTFGEMVNNYRER